MISIRSLWAVFPWRTCRKPSRMSVSRSGSVSAGPWSATYGIGFRSGVAKSKAVNTPLRQAAFVSAMIDQFIADKSGIDVLDKGGVPGLVADFLPASNAQMQSRVASTAQGQALNDDTVLLTPKELADALKGENQSIGVSAGYQNLPGGLIAQWGGIASVAAAAASVTFPIAFPNRLVMRGAFLNDVGGPTPPPGASPA